MNVTIEYQPEIRSMFLAPVGQILAIACVMVKSDDCQIYECFTADKHGYAAACRFMRLLERGYSPERARNLLIMSYGWGSFQYYFEISLHDKLSDEEVDALPIDCPDMMFTDPLTPADEERLYALWLRDGDEIFMFDEVLAERWNIPALLSNFRALAQGEDDKTSDWTHPHHMNMVQY